MSLMFHSKSFETDYYLTVDRINKVSKVRDNASNQWVKDYWSGVIVCIADNFNTRYKQTK